MEKSEGKKEAAPEPTLRYRRYRYASAQESKFKSTQDLFNHYMAQRKESYTQLQKKMGDLINTSDEKVSLITVRDLATSSLSLAITDEERASEIHMDMDQLSTFDKIWFHKWPVKSYMLI